MEKIDITNWQSTELLGALHNIREEGPDYSRAGLCHNVAVLCSFPTIDALQAMFLSWDEFSGDKEFPIKSDRPYISPHERYACREPMWDRNTEYGAARWRLLDHCIAYLEKKDHDD